MASEDDLQLALEFVSEGDQAVIPRGKTREVFSTESFQAETRRIRERSRPWTQGPGIQGLGLGEKVSGGKVSEDLALRVYVARKKPLSKVKNRVPKRVRVPEVFPDTPEVRNDICDYFFEIQRFDQHVGQ